MISEEFVCPECGGRLFDHELRASRQQPDGQIKCPDCGVRSTPIQQPSSWVWFVLFVMGFMLIVFASSFGLSALGTWIVRIAAALLTIIAGLKLNPRKLRRLP